MKTPIVLKDVNVPDECRVLDLRRQMETEPHPWREIRHIYCAPHHPQTNGKLERVHETLKARLTLLVYTSPEILRAAMAACIRFDNHERYHVGIGNVTPADVYDGRREAMLRRRAAQKNRTLARRVRYNRAVMRQGTRGELPGDLSVPHSLAESQRC